MAWFMPQLCSCEQDCPLIFILSTEKGQRCEMRKECCVAGFMALAVHLTARLKCCSGSCNCPGNLSHESASVSEIQVNIGSIPTKGAPGTPSKSTAISQLEAPRVSSLTRDLRG